MADNMTGFVTPRLVIADDFQPFLQSLRSFLSFRFNIVATAECGESALKAIRHYQPDIAVLDLYMPRLSGIQVAEELQKLGQPVAVVICSMDTNALVIENARRAGVKGFVLKSRFETELVPVLKLIVQDLFIAA